MKKMWVMTSSHETPLQGVKYARLELRRYGFVEPAGRLTRLV
jgi:hypothetical protein